MIKQTWVNTYCEREEVKKINANSDIKLYTDAEDESELNISSTQKHADIRAANENWSNNLKCMHIEYTCPMH